MVQNRSQRLLAVAATVIGLSLLFTPPAVATGPTADQRAHGSTRHMDFLPAQQGSSSQTQCKKPVSSRKGPWACIVSSKTSFRSTVSPNAARDVYCSGTTGGCWSIFNDFFAEFNTVSIEWGDFSGNIGNEHLLIEWHVQSGQYTALPVQSRNSSALVSTIFSGALSNGAVGAPSGGSVLSSCGPNTRGASAPSQLVSTRVAVSCEMFGHATIIR